MQAERPRAPWAQVLATCFQFGLLAVASYGLFLSDAGDRLVEILRGDIQEAEGELAEINRQKVAAEGQLAVQRAELDAARRNTDKAQFDLMSQRFELEKQRALADQAYSELSAGNARLAELDGALSKARPALISQRCRALISILAPYTGLEMKYRLYPMSRWIDFKTSARNRDFTDWASLKTAYDAWATKSYERDETYERIFKYIDQSISSELSDQVHWAQFKGERENAILSKFKIGSPAEFSPRFSDYFRDVRNVDDFLAESLRLGERRQSIERLTSTEDIESADPEYRAFKTRIRSATNPFLDDYSLYVSEKEASSAKSSSEIRQTVSKQLAYARNARAAQEAVLHVCYPNDPLQRLLLDL